LEAFYQTVNGEALSASVVDYLCSNFEVDDKGHLTRIGLMEFYLSQTRDDSGETWHDLERLGFDAQLKEKDTRYHQ